MDVVQVLLPLQEEQQVQQQRVPKIPAPHLITIGAGEQTKTQTPIILRGLQTEVFIRMATPTPVGTVVMVVRIADPPQDPLTHHLVVQVHPLLHLLAVVVVAQEVRHLAEEEVLQEVAADKHPLT